MVAGKHQALRDRGLLPWRQDLRRNGALYLMFIPIAAFFIIFHYVPMAGIGMAFQNYKVTKGLLGSAWVGLDNFRELFSNDMFPLALRNTAAMALLNLSLGFIAPVILALLVTQVRVKTYSRSVQTISYMPNFVSSVVVCSLAIEFLGDKGALTGLLSVFGLPAQNWLANANIPVFWLINTGIGIWQGAGWSSIIYIAAIHNINASLHEAACIDGANRFQRLWHITLPGILPIVMMMFTLQIGLVFRVGFDRVLLLYMPTTYEVADCLYTYTYRMAFGSTVDYGVSTASGLFQSVIATTLLIVSNTLNKKATGYALY